MSRISRITKLSVLSCAFVLFVVGCSNDKVTPLTMPADAAQAARPCDEDAASRVLEQYRMMGRIPSPQADKPRVVRSNDERWGPKIQCIIPIKSSTVSKSSSDPVTFTVFASPDYKPWFVNEHLPSIGGQLQEEYGVQAGEQILLAVVGDQATEAVWVSKDGLVVSVQSPNMALGIPEQRALLLAVASELRASYIAQAAEAPATGQ